MTLIDDISKTYTVNAKCTNCGRITEVRIPKGLTIKDFFNEQTGKCKGCGCTTLESVKSPKEDKPKSR